VIDEDINERMARFAPSQNIADQQLEPAQLDAIAALPQVQSPATLVGSDEDGLSAAQIAMINAMPAAGDTATKASLMAARGVNPDQAARARKIGAQTGVGADIAMRNLNEIERRAFMQEVDAMKIAERDPALARFLQNRDNAMVAHDDIKALHQTQGLFGDIATTAIGIGSEVYQAVTEGTAPQGMRMAPQAFEAGVQMDAAAREARRVRLQGNATEADLARVEAMQMASGQLMQETGGGFVAGSAMLSGQLKEPMSISVYRGAQTALVFGGAAAAAAPFTGGVSLVAVKPAMGIGFTAGFTASMVQDSYENIAGMAYVDMRREGISEENAQFYSGIAGIAGASLEVAGQIPFFGQGIKAAGLTIGRKVADQVIGRGAVRAAGTAAKSAGTSIASEGLTEGSQVVTDAVALHMAQRAEGMQGIFDTPEGRQKVIDDAISETLMVAEGMTLLSLPLPLLNFAGDLRRLRRSQERVARLQQAINAVSNSKTAQRDPDALKELIDARVDGNPDTDLYIDGAQMDVILRQSEVDPRSLDGLLPGFSERLAEAVATGGDIRMTQGEFLPKLALTDTGKAMTPHLRVGDPKDMNLLQQELFRQEQVANLEAIKKAGERAGGAAKEFVDSLNRVEDEIIANLEATGQYKPDEIRAFTTVQTSFVARLAPQLNMTPEQFWAEYRNEIVGYRVPQPAIDQPAQFNQLGQRRTDTPEFKAWNERPADQGGINKLVEPSGEPMRFYHGTQQGGFTAFDPALLGTGAGYSRGGFSFANSRERAQAYAERGDIDSRVVNEQIQAVNQILREPDMAQRFAAAGLGDGIAYMDGDPMLWDALSEEEVRDGLQGYIDAFRQAGDADMAARLGDILDMAEPRGVPQVYEVYLYAGQNVREVDATPETIGDVLAGIDVRSQPGGAVIVNMPNGERMVIVSDPRNIKSTDNRGTFSRETADIMAQQPVAPAEPRLMAVHNLSEENLQFAAQVGGLAVPSMGVVTTEQGGVEGFGEITMIGTQDMVDPATSRAFESDAYTARFPRPEWPKVPTAKADEAVAEIRGVANEFDDATLVDLTFDGMVNEPDANQVASNWMRSPAIQAMYLRSIGIDVAPVMETSKSLSNFDWDAIERLRPVFEAVNWDLPWDAVETTAEYQALAAAYADEVRLFYAAVAKQMPQGLMERLSTFDARAFQRLNRDMQQGQRIVVDRQKTRETLDVALEPHKAAYKQWVDTKVRSKFGSPFLRVGRLKKPYTIGNIVEVMASGRVKGKEKLMTYGPGVARAAVAREFKTLEEMRKAAKSAIVDPKEYSRARKESEAELEAYRLAAAEYTTERNYQNKPDLWAAFDNAMKALARYGKRKKRSAKAMRDALSRERFDVSNMPAELIEQAIDAANTLFTAPVPYFEAKPQRAVALNEFAGAVIPDNASPETRATLESAGVPMMEYPSGNDEARIAAVREMAIAQSERRTTVFQQPMEPSEPQGTFDIKDMMTRLNKGANIYTLIHESGHYWLEVMGRISARPDAPERIAADYDRILQWFGIAGATAQERAAAWNGMTLDQKRPHHEAFARNIELYMAEGKAPSLELQPAFERFMQWMKRFYVSMRDQFNEQYKREFGKDMPMFSVEMREVVERLIASDEQLERAKAVRNAMALFDVRPEGLTDAEWQALQDMQLGADIEALAKMRAEVMKSMKWLRRAEKGIIRDMQKESDERRAEVRAEVAETVAQEPVYRARQFLSRGTYVDADGNQQAATNHRLDIDAVRQMYELEPENLRPDLSKLGTGGYGMMGKGGMNPEVAAEMFGYDSADQMIRELIGAPAIDEAIEAQTDRRMLAENGTMNTPAQREEAIDRALHGELRARLIATQLRLVAKATQPVRVLQAAARQVARQLIGAKRLRDIRVREYVAAESRAARDAAEAYRGMPDPKRAGDAAYTRSINEQMSAVAAGMPISDAEAIAEEARKAAVDRANARRDEYRAKYPSSDPDAVLIAAKRNELLNHELAREAIASQEEVDKAVRYLRKVLSDDNRKRMGADASDQVMAVLENYSLASMTIAERKQVADLRSWLAAQEANGILVDIDPSLADLARRKNYTEMTLTEFRDLVDSVKQIEHRGKNERNIYLAGQKVIFEEVRDGVVASMTEVAEKKGRKVRKELGDEDRKLMNTIASYDASQQTMGNIVYVLDGGQRDGPLARALLLPAHIAGNQEATDRAAISKKLNDILGPLARKGQFAASKKHFPHINESLSLEQRMVIALNYGNESNIERLLNGEQWNAEQALIIIESLTEEQLNAVQAIWDVMSSFRDRVAEKSRRLTGKEPNWLEPVPMRVMSSDGKVVDLRGGYYPAKYNPRRSLGARELDIVEDAARLQREAYTATTTSRSFEKNRSDKPPVDQVLSRQLVAMYSGLSEVIHDLAWHDFAIAATRLLRDKEFQRVIKERYGLEIYNSIKD
jgi:hypothetical protein